MKITRTKVEVSSPRNPDPEYIWVYTTDKYTYNEIIEWAIRNRVGIYTMRTAYGMDQQFVVTSGFEIFALRWL